MLAGAADEENGAVEGLFKIFAFVFAGVWEAAGNSTIGFVHVTCASLLSPRARRWGRYVFSIVTSPRLFAFVPQRCNWRRGLCTRSLAPHAPRNFKFALYASHPKSLLETVDFVRVALVPAHRETLNLPYTLPTLGHCLKLWTLYPWPWSLRTEKP